jgi:transposase
VTPHADSALPNDPAALVAVGEDITEILEYRPGRFEVVRHVRPAFSCRTCEAMTQAPMPSLPIERGRPGPGLLAHDGTPSQQAGHLQKPSRHAGCMLIH